MRKIILTLVFVMGIMGLSAAARAETSDWMNPDSPLALGLHPRLLFIPDEYRATHPDAVGLTVQEMRDKLISHPDYISEFQEFINTMDSVFDEDPTTKTRYYCTWDAINYAFLYILNPSIMSQSPYNFTFGHTKEEYGNKAIKHSEYIANRAKNADGNLDGWIDYYTYPHGKPDWGITNISMAIVNDWVNDKVSKELSQKMLDGMRNLYNRRTKSIWPFAAASWSIAQNGDTAALSFYGDDIDNPQETTYQNYVATFLDSLYAEWIQGFGQLYNKFLGQGATSPVGPTYYLDDLQFIMPFVPILATALNKNYFNTVTYLRDYPLCELYYIKPRPIKDLYDSYYERFSRNDSGGGLEVTTMYGWYKIISNSIITMLSEDKPDNAALMKWLVDNSGLFQKNDLKNIRYFYVFYHFFMGNKDVISKSPTELNLPLSKNVGGGEYVMRTGFTDPDASMVVFFAQKYHNNDGGHAHRDFSAFSIGKYGDLAISRSISKGFGVGNFYQTKKHMFYNTIGVHNPEAVSGDNFMDYRGGYDDTSLAPDAPAYDEGGANHVGAVIDEDLEGVNYDYIDYDYTHSWGPSHYQYEQKVDYAEREFVYLRSAGGIDDEYVVVFDRINSIDPNYPKYWLLHASFEPKLLDNNDENIEMMTEDYPNDADGIGGGRWVNKSSTPSQNNIIEITNNWSGVNTNNSHGRLYNKTLLPEQFQINKVGGPGHYWEDAEGRLVYPGYIPGDSYSKYTGVKTFNDMPQAEKDFYNKYYNGNPGPDGKYYYLTDWHKDDRGTYTMQVQSTTNQKFDNFLNVIQFGDSNTLIQMNPVSRIDGDVMVGAFIGDPHSPRVVLFSQDQKGASVQSVRYKVNYFAALTGKHLLVDMEPGKYDVFKNGVKVHSDLSALDKKGTLYFEANGDSSQEESKESVFQVVRTGEIPAPITITGDINGDKKVNVLDVQLCVNVALGNETDTDRVKRANVNEDEFVNVLDVQRIVNVILGN